MVFIRIVVLAFLTFFSFSMGTTPASQLNSFGTLVAGLFFVFAPALYLLPIYEAWSRGHPNLVPIALVNIFLGWSLVGWVVALVWALKQAEEVTVVPTSAAAPPAVVPPLAAVAPIAARETRACPFCAEEVLVAAVKCKHCGSAIGPADAVPST